MVAIGQEPTAGAAPRWRSQRDLDQGLRFPDGVNHVGPAKVSSKKETPCSALPVFLVTQKTNLVFVPSPKGKTAWLIHFNLRRLPSIYSWPGGRDSNASQKPNTKATQPSCHPFSPPPPQVAKPRGPLRQNLLSGVCYTPICLLTTLPPIMEPDFRRVLVWTSFFLKGCQVPGQLVEGQNPVLLIWLCILMWNAFPNDWTYIYIYIPTCQNISPVNGCGLFRGPAKWCFSLSVSL